MKLKKIIKNGKPVWMADLGIWQGKRERLFRANKVDAEAEIASRKKLMRRDGERIYNLSNQEIARLMAADERAKAHGFDSVNQCVEIAIAVGKPIEPKNLNEAITECIAAKKLSGKRHTYIRKFSSHLNTFKVNVENNSCHHITRQQIEEWAWSGKDGKVKPVSAKSRITDMRTFFSFCVKRKWCLKNPVEEIEKILLEDKPPVIHTVEQAQTLLKNCLEHVDGKKVVCYVALSYFGGLRPAEILRLKPEDIGEDFVNVEGPKSKTRLRRLVPVNDTLRAWLKISSVPRCKNFHRNFGRVKAVVPWSHDVLRHSFCSYGMEKFSAEKISKWAGHSEQILFAHYRERVKPEEAEQFWEILP